MRHDIVFDCLSSGVVRDIINPIQESVYVYSRQARHYHYTGIFIRTNQSFYNLIKLIEVRWQALSLLKYKDNMLPTKLRLVLIYSSIVQWLLKLASPPILKVLNANALLVGYKNYDLT